MRKRYTLRKLCIAIVDLLLLLLATQLASSVVLTPTINAVQHFTGPTVFSITAYLFFFYIFELYSSSIISRWRESLFRIIWSFVLGFVGTGFIFYSLGHWQYPQWVFLLQAVFGAALLASWRWLYLRYFRHPVLQENALIIGSGKAGSDLLELLAAKPNPFSIQGLIDDDPNKLHQSVKKVPVVGNSGQLEDLARQTKAQHIILAVTHDRTEALMQKLLQLRLGGIQIHEMAAVYESLSRSIPAHHIQERWILFESGFDILCRPTIQQAKRVIDTVSAAVLLIVTSPLLLATAIAVKLDSPGSALFRQTRVGLNDKEFTLYKFRSMRNDAEKNGAVWAQENDPRVTRVGKWLRLLRIDELPQLFNVLKGDMSLIGPRPERPEFVHELEEQLPYYYIRHLVRPGITGWAQVNYPYGATVEDALRKLEYELYYVKNMSVFLEAKIVLKTLGVMIFGKGAR